MPLRTIVPVILASTLVLLSCSASKAPRLCKTDADCAARADGRCILLLGGPERSRFGSLQPNEPHYCAYPSKAGEQCGQSHDLRWHTDAVSWLAGACVGEFSFGPPPLNLSSVNEFRACSARDAQRMGWSGLPDLSCPDGTRCLLHLNTSKHAVQVCLDEASAFHGPYVVWGPSTVWPPGTDKHTRIDVGRYRHGVSFGRSCRLHGLPILECAETGADGELDLWMRRVPEQEVVHPLDYLTLPRHEKDDAKADAKADPI